MDFTSVLASLQRNALGAILIALQVALTVAIVSNALSVIQQRTQRMERPTGIDETHIFTIANQWTGTPTDLPSRIREDAAELRTIDGVVNVWAAQSYPLRGGGAGTAIKLSPDQRQPTTIASVYFADEHTASALGMHLLSGRWFLPTEIRDFGVADFAKPPASVAIITHELAQSLFSQGNALGKSFYTASGGPVRIVGIVDRMQASWAATQSQLASEHAIFTPASWADPAVIYLVRTQPGKQSAAMLAARAKLFTLSRSRTLTDPIAFSETRARAYRSERSLSLILSALCVLLLIVTALGIVGLSTYWVNRRRRQIGIMRALGARRLHIVLHFQTENLLVAGAGALFGVALGLIINLWLAGTLQIERMQARYVVGAALIGLLLGQIANIWPALRAAAVPPATAARGT
jgi:putative ABC transport system permease protein